MERDAYLEATTRESTNFAAAVERDGSAPVATCPGWSVADLAVHLGVIHRWATAMVRTQATAPLRDRERHFAIEPNDPGLVDWFVAGARELVEVLTACPSELPVWSWMPEDCTARFWQRRQAHETAVHRWDAEAAIGEPGPIEPALAADGIDEYLHVFAAGRSRARSTRAGDGESFHFHCTDTAGEWTVRFDGPSIDVSRVHTKADVAIRAERVRHLAVPLGTPTGRELGSLGDVPLLDAWTALVPPI